MTNDERGREEDFPALTRNEERTAGPDRLRRNRRFLQQTHDDGDLLGIFTLPYEHPLVAPQLTHLRQVPFRTMVNCLHSGQGSPS